MSALEFVAFAYIGGITTVRGAIFGALLAPGALIALAMTNLNISPTYLLIIGGLGLMLSVVYLPDGAALARPAGPAAGRARRAALVRRVVRPVGATEKARRESPSPRARRVLRTEGLSRALRRRARARRGRPARSRRASWWA